MSLLKCHYEEFWVWPKENLYKDTISSLSPSKNMFSTFFTLWTPRTVSGHVVPGHFHANLIWPLEIKPRRGELLSDTSTRMSTQK